MYPDCRIVSISTAIVHICLGGGGDSVVYLQVDKAPYSGQVKTKWRRAGLRYADGSGASVHVCTIDTPQSSLSLSLSLCSVIPSLSCLCRQPLRIHIQLRVWKRKQLGQEFLVDKSPQMKQIGRANHYLFVHFGLR